MPRSLTHLLRRKPHFLDFATSSRQFPAPVRCELQRTNIGIGTGGIDPVTQSRNEAPKRLRVTFGSVAPQLPIPFYSIGSQFQSRAVSICGHLLRTARIDQHSALRALAGLFFLMIFGLPTSAQGLKLQN